MDPSVSRVALGATFDNLQDLKDACKANFIDNAFEYRVLKANKTRCTIVCKAEACPWRLHASSIHDSSLFRIKTYKSEHSCFGINYVKYRQYCVEGRCPPMLFHVQSLLVRPSSGWESPRRFDGIQNCLRLLGKLSHSRYQLRKSTREELLQPSESLFLSFLVWRYCGSVFREG